MADQPPYPQKTHDTSLTLKDYLETATDASRRTRFITIVMVVASVLLLVSVLNSWDYGWISLRLKALNDPTSNYALEKYPLLCECEPRVKKFEEPRTFCAKKVKPQPDAAKIFWPLEDARAESVQREKELADLKSQRRQLSEKQQEAAGGNPDAQKEELTEQIVDKKEEVKAARRREDKVCEEEFGRLTAFHDTLQRTAAETKYMVRVPFFGVALDVNDVGFMGGISLSIILMLLRLSLRSQIVSLRIGFKAALARGEEGEFYDVLAARQMFVFPPLEADDQEPNAARGWIERWWVTSRFSEHYRRRCWRFARKLKRKERRIEALLKARATKSGKELTPRRVKKSSGKGKGPAARRNVWRVNPHTALQVVPKLLCLLPFVLYLFQFSFDIISSLYGFNLSTPRMWVLIILDLGCLAATFCFGLWCVTKWNEIDKLWEYFEARVGEKVVSQTTVAALRPRRRNNVSIVRRFPRWF